MDRAAFYQLKTMMQGVLARGTARTIADLAPYVAGKTGTSDEENDAWFVGFTNDVTVAVWLGYDNADGKRRTLGGGATGGGVAVPIFEPIIQAVWAHVAPRTALAPPSAEAKQQLSCTPAGGGISECLRKDAKGRIADTQYRLISRAHASARRERDDEPSHRVRSARRDRDDEPSHRVRSAKRDRDDEAPHRARRQATSAHVVLRRSSYASWVGMGSATILLALVKCQSPANDTERRDGGVMSLRAI